MKSKGLFLLIPAFSLVLAPSIKTAQQQSGKLLDIDSFMEMETVDNPEISPDGENIIFARTRVDKVNDRFNSNLWIVDIEGRKARELTTGNWHDSSPVWSPDGKKVAFISDRDGTPQIHVMWLDTREAAQLTHIENTPTSVAWSPDGKQLAFTMFIPDEKPILNVELPRRPKAAKWAEPAVIIDRLSWRTDGIGPLPKGDSHIFVLDAELGGTPRKVTSGDYSHSNPAWSADGRKIFFSAIRKPDAEYLRYDSEIYVVDLKTLEITALTDRKGPDEAPRISPDGKWIAYTGYDEQNLNLTLSSLYLMDSAGGGKKLLAGGLPGYVRYFSWAGDGSGVYYVMAEKGESNLYFVSTAGKIRRVTEGVHYVPGISLSRTGQAAAVISTFHEPGYLAAFSLLNPAAVKTLVDVNRDVLDGVKLGDVEELWYKSPDGLDIQGWLVKPAEFDPARKYPLVLDIHGGPWVMYGVGFNWSWQNFAARGYAVLYINPRGSVGYGQDFVNAIDFAYPGKDFDDLMAGVDAAIAKGFIDKDNLFVCGGSYGGVLTDWIVGHTNRFRAAVSISGVSNWLSMVGTTDSPIWYRMFRKYPWEDPMEYVLRSPLHYVANVTTPTMVMMGEMDLRAPASQCEEFYRALKILKKETVLVRMPGEYHGWRRASHRLLRQQYLMAWFEKYRINKEAAEKE